MGESFLRNKLLTCAKKVSTLESLVTKFENLDKSAKHIPSIASPNILGTSRERMKGGKVTFRFTLNALASMTNPIHRKFRFKLVCDHDRLKKYAHLSDSTFDFYSVSRIRPKGEGAAAGS